METIALKQKLRTFSQENFFFAQDTEANNFFHIKNPPCTIMKKLHFMIVMTVRFDFNTPTHGGF